MSYTVHIAPSAQLDLEEAYIWWAENRSKEQADRWYHEILNAIETLETMPHRCPLCEEAELLPSELRQLLFGIGHRTTHRIVFHVSDGIVNIARVRHVSQAGLGEVE